MHTVSTGTSREILNVHDACAQTGGRASVMIFTFSPDIPYLQALWVFVLLANVQRSLNALSLIEITI
jgi:hypothetical protein